MQALERTCPNCIFNIIRVIMVYLNKKLGKKHKSYDGMSQFEEEEFSISFDNLQQQKQSSALVQPKIQYTFQNNEFEANRDIVSFSPPSNTLSNQVKSQNTEKFIESVPQFNSLNFQDFNINLSPYDQYYDLIQSKTKSLQSYFRSQQYKLIDLHKNNSLNKSRFQIRQYPAKVGFKFIIRYELPCSYSFYMKINKSMNIVKSLYDKIANFQLLQTVYPNLQVLNLEFKKIMGLGMEPRKFTYLKYVNTCNEVHWQTCISIDPQNSQKYNPIKKDSIKSADLLSITHLHERKMNTEIEEQAKLLVETYLEVNLHSIVKAEKLVHKGLSEIKAYIESLYEYAATNYHDQNDYA